MNVAVRHLPHALPQSNLDVCSAATPNTPNQLQRHSAALGQDAEAVLAEEQLLPHPSSYSQAALCVPDKNHSPSSTQQLWIFSV